MPSRQYAKDRYTHQGWITADENHAALYISNADLIEPCLHVSSERGVDKICRKRNQCDDPAFHSELCVKSVYRRRVYFLPEEQMECKVQTEGAQQVAPRQQAAAYRSCRSTSAPCSEQKHHDASVVAPGKCFSRREVTTKAVRDGMSALPSKLTYCRSFNVSRICAYVEGLPIPSVSSSLIKDASVYLAGGFVLWASGVTSLQST